VTPQIWIAACQGSLTANDWNSENYIAVFPRVERRLWAVRVDQAGADASTRLPRRRMTALSPKFMLLRIAQVSGTCANGRYWRATLVRVLSPRSPNALYWEK